MRKHTEYTKSGQILEKLSLIKDLAGFDGYKIDYFGNIYTCWKTKPRHALGKAGGVGSDYN
jgi:gentisate 1,2-dioxygenase